ncbi:MAG: serpin family protein [Actinomycetia bacterium]|nr:serpin family protein [Actinomycetes bacterium]
MNPSGRTRLIASFLALAMIASACGSDGGRAGQELATDVEREPASGSAPVTETARALNSIGFSLFETLPPDLSTILSPSSIGHAVLMARAAADESTGSAIDSAMGLPAGVEAHDGWNAIDQAIGDAVAVEDELTITMADRLWPRLDVDPDQEWLDLLASRHGADVLPLDFGGDTEGSREVINQWVAEQTEDLIPELLAPGFVTAETVLVLTDTLYLAARWQQVFGKYGTETAPFHRLDGSTVEVELMRDLELGAPRGVGDGYAGAEIPYVGGQFSMLVIVPQEGRFTEVRDRFGPQLLAEIDGSFSTGPYELLLPGWKDTSTIDLLPLLTGIGAAPGSYPSISPGAVLGAAVHGADITVDDWGTVAAAATALGFDESGPPEPELTIRVDRPFLYAIRNVDSGLILFLGQMVDPSV